MKDIIIGKEYSCAYVVQEHDLANRVGSGEVAVFATPMMIARMEQCASTLLKEFLEDEETSVGAMIHTTHDAPTPCGMRVEINAQITEVKGKRISFAITAKDERHTIGTAHHERVVVDKGRFEAKATGLN